MFFKEAPCSTKKIKQIIDTKYKSIDKNSEDYIRYAYSVCKSWFSRPYEINVETNRLLDIACSDEPVLFIMNHTKNQSKDINAAKFFNTLLYREYLYHGKGATCPRSKILANKKILEKQPDNGDFYEWLGVTPIYAGIKGKKEDNRNVLNNLVREFVDKKINFFIFPEGALAGLTFLPLNYKFQPGAASFVKKVLDTIEKVKVIPITFAHNKHRSAIHIGKPLYFEKGENSYQAAGGNIAGTKLEELYSGKNSITITEQGEPVKREKIIPYISGIMIENMKSCIENVKQELKNIKPEIFEI